VHSIYLYYCRLLFLVFFYEKSMQIKRGDLVLVRQTIKELADFHGKSVGIVVKELDPPTNPALLEVMWPDAELENLYEDELELVVHESR
jgi:hypothetical protein